MKLAELDPRWISETTFAFRCPHCRDIWLTCTTTPTRHDVQMKAAQAAAIGDGEVFVLCNPETGWNLAEGVRDFATMSVTPSLDASKSGHWHGHITDGEIK